MAIPFLKKVFLPVHKAYFATMNYFFNASGKEDNAFDFSQLKTEDFIPALDYALGESRKNLDQITSNEAQASVENTLIALEQATEKLDIVTTIYFNLFSAEADDNLQSLAKEISPKLAAFNSDFYLNPRIYERLMSLSKLNLPSLEQRLLDLYLKRFKRNGANLNAEDKEKLRSIDNKLSTLGPQFSENVLKATNDFTLFVETDTDLKRLPTNTMDNAAKLAEEKGKKGYLFTLQAPSMIPFLDYCDNQELRKEMFLAYSNRCNGGDHDNTSTILKMVELRGERSQLLGYKTHAEYVLEDRMAKSPENVVKFLNELKSHSKKAATNELDEIKETFSLEQIAPWDIRYYIEKLRERKLNYNSDELMPYFSTDNVIHGLFHLAEKLFKLRFEKINDVPVYHEEVHVYKSYIDDQYQGLLYLDLYPRETKKPGAWMTCYREQQDQQRPHVSLCCNFSRPDSSGNSLLTLDEVQTLYHEFGHGLHALLSDVAYKSLSGTNVLWDFVELPSQLMENWTLEQGSLELFAKHFKTKETIPDSLIEKIKESRKFMAGYATMRQLKFATLDMAWHTAEKLPSKITSWEREIFADLELLPSSEDITVSTAFSHIFAGGYSAGYYSYKWAEVLEADAYSLFQEEGVFSQKVASSLVKNILSAGNSEDPETLFKNFRGRDPSPEALLRRDGLLAS